MDLSRGILDENSGLIYLNDRVGSLYVYDFDRLRKLYNARRRPKVWTPYIRRAIGYYNNRLIYSDGRNTFLVDGLELLPIELPPGIIIDYDLICGEDRYYYGERKSVDGSITACKNLEEPAIAYFLNGIGKFIHRDIEINLKGDLVSVISENYLGTIKGRLISLEEMKSKELVGSVRYIYEFDRLYILTRRNGRSLLLIIEGDEIENRIAFNGRFNGFIKIDESLLLFGERIEEVEV